jgi:hypothetical protein
MPMQGVTQVCRSSPRAVACVEDLPAPHRRHSWHQDAGTLHDHLLLRRVSCHLRCLRTSLRPRCLTTTADLSGAVRGSLAKRRPSNLRMNTTIWMRRFQTRPSLRMSPLRPYPDSHERAARLVRNGNPRTLICSRWAHIHRYTQPTSPRMQSDHTAGPLAHRRTPDLGWYRAQLPLLSHQMLLAGHNAQNLGVMT